MGTGLGGNTKLRAARQALGLRSQQQLADAVTRSGTQIGLRISITERTVRRWESENPPWPSPDHQAALEQLFGRTVTELGFSPPWVSDDTEISQQERRPEISTMAGSGALGIFPRRAVNYSLPSSIAADYIGITSA
jgi:transcriptional regulator with XRE-family HTH domain